MNRIRPTAWRALLAAGVVALLATACGTDSGSGSSSGTEAAAASDTLNMPLLYTFNPDPDVFFDLEGVSVTAALYEGLVREEPDSTEIVPWLAESWEVSPDGTTYTFTLRDDIAFPDGTPIDSTVVKQSFERRSAVESSPSYMLAEVESYETPDDTTFVVNLATSVNNFMERMAAPWGPRITNPALLEEHAADGDLGQAWLTTNSAGSGPYEITEWVPDERVVLTRSEDYWGDAPEFDQVVFRVIPDLNTQRLELEQGKLDMMQGLPPSAADQLSTNDDVEVVEVPGINKSIVQVNVTKAPFDDPAVRQALIASIPYDQLVSDVWGDYATAATQLPPAGMMDEQYAVFAPELDAEAFAEATADVDKSEPVVVEYVQFDEGTSVSRVTDYLVELLRGAGFEAQSRAVPVADYFGYIGAPDVAPNLAVSTQPADGTHPDNWFRLFLHSAGSLNVGGAGLPETDALMDEAVAMPPGDDAAVDELYSQAADLLVEDAQLIPIADVPVMWATSTAIAGVPSFIAVPQAVWISLVERSS